MLQLRTIHRYVTVTVFQMLVTSLALSRLDFVNSILVGLPASQVRRFQSVQNATARLIFNLRRPDHVTDTLVCLHCLRVPERIQFKLAVLTYRALSATAPSYLSEFVAVSSLAGRRGVMSAETSHLLVPRIRQSTVGPRAFPVAGETIWTSSPVDITSAPRLSSVPA